MRVLILACAAVGLSGCIYISDNNIPDGDFDSDLGGPERLYGAMVEPDGVRIRVASNGCTDEQSFDVDVDRVGGPGDARFRVRFARETPDRCRAYLVDGVELFFSRQRLGLPDDARITIANRIVR
jgi:hypothetical protein